jgi:putative glutamine amidotransferase
VKLVAVTLRTEPAQGEIRDCLDQKWSAFLNKAGFTPLLVPNHPASLNALLTLPLAGVLLTGGGDLEAYGGAPHGREATEKKLFSFCREKKLPLLGVCRGMQALQNFFGEKLHRVEGHVSPRQKVCIRDQWEEVNSYHQWGTQQTTPPLVGWAYAQDGTVKAVRHESLPFFGIMWHPERLDPFREEDTHLFQEVFT